MNSFIFCFSVSIHRFTIGNIFLLLLLIVSSAHGAQRIVEKPADTVARVGDTVQLRCRVADQCQLSSSEDEPIAKLSRRAKLTVLYEPTMPQLFGKIGGRHCHRCAVFCRCATHAANCGHRRTRHSAELPKSGGKATGTAQLGIGGGLASAKGTDAELAQEDDKKSSANSSTSSSGYELKVELPDALDKWQIMPSWDRDCDRDLLIGVHKHVSGPRWRRDDTNSQNVINWGRFRELSICLHKKTDRDLLELLYCVLAMCTCVQSVREGFSTLDEGRAERVDPISAKAAEKLMNRHHLMRKVHAIITMGIQNIRGMLKMVALDVMPKGWTEAHDEHLLIVVDKFGLEDIHGKVKLLPKLFESVGPNDEHILLRRVVEICITLETAKWSGPASIEMLLEEGAGQAQRVQQQQQQQHQVPSTSGGGVVPTVQQQQQSAGNNAICIFV
ncbi:hypothetical protein niasHT_008165 [Heterodera trifolii]|uniref:Uncharacterized protein n=1 Tax=Heterodera trifolii TaxID=157864 RepID=A0ABD2LU97_9BILA